MKSSAQIAIEDSTPEHLAGQDLALLPFQKEAVAKMLHFLKKSGGCYNASEMGLGKTIQTIVALLHLNPPTTLIICPAVMQLVWAEELNKWANGSLDCTIVSYDYLTRHVEDYTGTYSAVVLDEAHYIKSRKAKRTKAIIDKILPNAKYKIFLSGTPFTQSVVDGFTVFSALAPKDFPNFYEFANRYSYIKRTPWGDKYFGVKNHEELSAIIRSRFYLRYKKEEVLKDLPEKQFIKIPLPKQYDVKVDPAELDTVRLELQEILDKVGKGESVGVVPKALGSVIRRQGLAKVKPVSELVQDFLEQNLPIVLFCWHRDVIIQFLEVFKAFKPAVIVGDTSARDRQLAIQRFQSGDTDLFIGQMAAAGVGITLTRSTNVVLAELPWSPGTVAQAVDRVHRIGQKGSVSVYYFVVKSSIEEKIAGVLMDKAISFSKVLDG